jgi:hypothetical protein
LLHQSQTGVPVSSEVFDSFVSKVELSRLLLPIRIWFGWSSCSVGAISAFPYPVVLPIPSFPKSVRPTFCRDSPPLGSSLRLLPFAFRWLPLTGGDAPPFQGAFFPGAVPAFPSAFGVSTTFPSRIGAFHGPTALLTPSWPRSERPISCRVLPSPGWSPGLLPLAARVRWHSRFPLGRGRSVRPPAFGYYRRSRVRWRSRLPHGRGRRAPTSVAVHPRWAAVHPRWADRCGCYCSLPACSLRVGMIRAPSYISMMRRTAIPFS